MCGVCAGRLQRCSVGPCNVMRRNAKERDIRVRNHAPVSRTEEAHVYGAAPSDSSTKWYDRLA